MSGNWNPVEMIQNVGYDLNPTLFFLSIAFIVRLHIKNKILKVKS